MNGSIPEGKYHFDQLVIFVPEYSLSLGIY